MFEAKLEEGLVMAKVVEAVREVITDTNWECDERGLSIQCMDASHVALVSVVLPREVFQEYRCDRIYSLGINMPNCAKVFKCAAAGDTVEVCHRDGTDTASFVFLHKNEDKVSDYEINLLNLDLERLDIPGTDYQAVVTLPSLDFQRMVRDLSQFDDSVTITVTQQGVQFAASGVGSGQGIIACMKLAVTQEQGKERETVSVRVEGTLTLSYTLKYLCLFSKAAPLAPSVTLSLAPEHPLVVQYAIAELGHVRYYVAPRVEDPEDMENNNYLAD